MKLINKIICILLIPLLLTSCFQSEQLNERLLVQAIGIDLIDDAVEITLQVYVPATQGGSGISASPDNAKTVKVSGFTVTQALENATLTQGKSVFMGHNRILVLGKDLAENDILSALDYFSSNASSRHNINVVIANGKASDILTSKINQGIVPAETLEKMIIRANEIGLLKNVKLYELLSTLENDFESAVLPIIELIEETNQDAEEKDETIQVNTDNQNDNSNQNILDEISNIRIKGMGIIKNGKMIEQLNIEETRGLLFILNDVKETTFTVQNQEFGLTAIKIYNSNSKITPTVKNGEITFNLEVNAQAMLGQREHINGVKLSDSSLIQLELELNKMIENQCKLAFEKAVTQSNSDIFDLGNLLWIHNTALWKSKKDNWEEAVNEINFTVKSNAIINRVGLEF